MQYKFLAVVALAASVMAAPNPFMGGDKKTTMQEAVAACGNNLTVTCCNKATTTGNSVNVAKGFLAGILGDDFSGAGLGVFDGCSKIDVPVAVPGGAVSDLLSNNCKQTPACCQNSDLTQGYVNFGIPCVALSSIV